MTAEEAEGEALMGAPELSENPGIPSLNETVEAERDRLEFMRNDSGASDPHVMPWAEFVDADRKQIYYYNFQTDERSDICPPELQAQLPREHGLAGAGRADE